MIRQFPIIPTIIVVAAAGVMMWLGIWQLGRAEEKADLIARYEAALATDAEIDWPSPADYSDALFAQSKIDCKQVRGIDSIGGKSARGRTGWIHIARCSHGSNGVADVTIGWSLEPVPPPWEGGVIKGRIVSYGDTIRLIADEPVAGLQPLARPDPKELPNNHLAYAGQWFFFALTALIIYWLAVKSRAAKRD